MSLRSALLLPLLLGVTPVLAQDLWVEGRVLLPLRVRLPEGYDPRRSYPLVLALHGRGGGPDALLPLHEVFGKGQVILAVPQAPYPQGGGTRWFHSSPDPKILAATDAWVVEFILTTLRSLRQRYALGPVYLFGHSEGGALAYLLGARARSEFAGLICFGAGDPAGVLQAADFPKLQGLPILVAQGKDDPVMPFGRGKAAVELLRSHGAMVTFEPYAGGHGLEPAPLQAASAWLRDRLPRDPAPQRRE